MPVSKAHMRATQKYEQKNYDKILLRLRRDGTPNKEDIEKAAEMLGESVNAFITNAISQRIKEISPV